MKKEIEKLTVTDGETLMDMRLPPTKFCVETLLPQGVIIFGGAPKIGKRASRKGFVQEGSCGQKDAG